MIKSHKIKKLRRKFICARNRTLWFTDSIEKHPFEISLSLALILFGAIAILNGLSSTPGSVQTLPIELSIAYCALSVLGGMSVLFGLFAQVKIPWAYGFERFGLFVSASAWASYIVGLALNPVSGRSTLVILALTAFAIGCLLRARSVKRRESATLHALRHAQISQGDFDG